MPLSSANCIQSNGCADQLIQSSFCDYQKTENLRIFPEESISLSGHPSAVQDFFRSYCIVNKDQNAYSYNTAESTERKDESERTQEVFDILFNPFPYFSVFHTAIIVKKAKFVNVKHLTAGFRGRGDIQCADIPPALYKGDACHTAHPFCILLPKKRCAGMTVTVRKSKILQFFALCYAILQ